MVVQGVPKGWVGDVYEVTCRLYFLAHGRYGYKDAGKGKLDVGDYVKNGFDFGGEGIVGGIQCGHIIG